MKKAVKPYLLALAAIGVIGIILWIIFGSGITNKYFSELKASYSYDKNNQILIKYPSELQFESAELLSYENKKTKKINYETLNLTLPKRDYTTREINDYKVTVGYAVHNGKIIFTEIPMQFSMCKTFALGDNTDSFVMAIDDDNAFLVNLNGYSPKKLFNEDDIDSYFDKRATTKLVFAKIISVSPDGEYILYESNRNYVKTGSPTSLDIYAYDVKAQTETLLMNFDGKEFLCWEKTDIQPGASGNFLFREVNVTSANGKSKYSPVRQYSIVQAKEVHTMNINFSSTIYDYYEMIDDQYFYSVQNKTKEDLSKETIIIITDIYSLDAITVSSGKYSSFRDIKISESKEYIAFFGNYIIASGDDYGKLMPEEIVTVNLETKNIVKHYGQNEGNYTIDSFFWCPDNVLILNFIDMPQSYGGNLCRFYKIDHK